MKEAGRGELARPDQVKYKKLSLQQLKSNKCDFLIDHLI